jgi:D-beta-D-heptose 7-phosphate kinase/D-beta-D-heptose 1-phosphate adenosyltransferase
VLSDYAKGALTPHCDPGNHRRGEKGGASRSSSIPRLADYSIYRGATVIKPNRKELSDATRRRVDTDDDVIAAASELNRLLGPTPSWFRSATPV